MANIAYVISSIDGFVTDTNGKYSWIFDIHDFDPGLFGFDEFESRIDAVVMGANTYNQLKTAIRWPYTKPSYALGEHLEVPDHLQNSVKVLSGSEAEIVETIQKHGHKNLAINGVTTITQFMNAGLIDELQVSYISKVLGDGRKMFGSSLKTTHFTIQESRVVGANLIWVKYASIRGNA